MVQSLSQSRRKSLVRADPQDAMFVAVAGLCADAKRAGRDDVAHGPLVALALACRAVSGRASRYLGFHTLNVPASFSLFDLVELWRKQPPWDRAHRNPAKIEAAVRHVLQQ